MLASMLAFTDLTNVVMDNRIINMDRDDNAQSKLEGGTRVGT